MAQGALDGLSVLEIASGVAGPYTGKMLADFGARVVKVEPPGGDPLRRARPVVNGESAFFNWLNAGKRSIEATADEARLDGLIRGSEIVVHDRRGDEADALEARIVALNPSAVVLSLTPYGRTGPRAGWQGTPLTEYATGGFHYYGGRPDREPLALPGYQVEFHAGMQGGIATLAGLWYARNHGVGQRIEISHQESMLSAQSWLVSAWTHTGQVLSRTGSIFVPCADGFVYLFHLVPYPNVFVLMERFDLLEDETLQNPLTWQQRFPEILEAFGQWAKDRTKAEIYHACQELRIAVSPVNTMSDLASNEHLAFREAFSQVEVGGEAFVAPGFPFKLMGTPCEVQGAAPALGANNVLLDAPPTPARTPVIAGGSNGHDGDAPGPLAGIRVIEMTANWAGPVCGRHLADLGAEVIKLELATKPATRGLIPAGGDLAWPRAWERFGYFAKMNRNKKDICLNIATPEGRAVFLDLIRGADVLLENNSARVMPQLGYDFEHLREVNPRLIMCSMSGFGGTGPERNYSAYGSNIETVSGLASVLGYGPDDFYGTGSFYADPVSGGHGAVAILAALHARERTGQGQWIDMALLEAVMPFFAQQFLEYSVTGENPQPLANRDPEYWPQGVYRSGGTDAWLAVSVRDTDEWHALCDVIGRDDLRDDPALQSAEGRRAASARIDEAISQWSAPLDHNVASAELQQAGVPAAPVMANWEVYSDNHLHARDFYVMISHPVAGTFPWPGFPWRFERTPGRIYSPPPLFGEHNTEVFRGILGLDDAAVQALYDSGTTSDEPQYAVPK